MRERARRENRIQSTRRELLRLIDSNWSHKMKENEGDFLTGNENVLLVQLGECVLGQVGFMFEHCPQIGFLILADGNGEHQHAIHEITILIA